MFITLNGNECSDKREREREREREYFVMFNFFLYLSQFHINNRHLSLHVGCLCDADVA